MNADTLRRLVASLSGRARSIYRGTKGKISTGLEDIELAKQMAGGKGLALVDSAKSPKDLARLARIGERYVKWKRMAGGGNGQLAGLGEVFGKREPFQWWGSKNQWINNPLASVLASGAVSRGLENYNGTKKQFGNLKQWIKRTVDNPIDITSAVNKLRQDPASHKIISRTREMMEDGELKLYTVKWKYLTEAERNAAIADMARDKALRAPGIEGTRFMRGVLQDYHNRLAKPKDMLKTIKGGLRNELRENYNTQLRGDSGGFFPEETDRAGNIIGYAKDSKGDPITVGTDLHKTVVGAGDRSMFLNHRLNVIPLIGKGDKLPNGDKAASSVYLTGHMIGDNLFMGEDIVTKAHLPGVRSSKSSLGTLDAALEKVQNADYGFAIVVEANLAKPLLRRHPGMHLIGYGGGLWGGFEASQVSAGKVMIANTAGLPNAKQFLNYNMLARGNAFTPVQAISGGLKSWQRNIATDPTLRKVLIDDPRLNIAQARTRGEIMKAVGLVREPRVADNMTKADIGKIDAIRDPNGAELLPDGSRGRYTSTYLYELAKDRQDILMMAPEERRAFMKELAASSPGYSAEQMDAAFDPFKMAYKPILPFGYKHNTGDLYYKADGIESGDLTQDAFMRLSGAFGKKAAFVPPNAYRRAVQAVKHGAGRARMRLKYLADAAKHPGDSWRIGASSLADEYLEVGSTAPWRRDAEMIRSWLRLNPTDSRRAAVEGIRKLRAQQQFAVGTTALGLTALSGAGALATAGAMKTKRPASAVRQTAPYNTTQPDTPVAGKPVLALQPRPTQAQAMHDGNKSVSVGRTDGFGAGHAASAVGAGLLAWALGGMLPKKYRKKTRALLSLLGAAGGVAAYHAVQSANGKASLA